MSSSYIWIPEAERFVASLPVGPALDDECQFRRGAAAAEEALEMWPEPDREAKWQEIGRRIGNPLLTGALDLLADGFAVLPLLPREKDPRWGGVYTGWMRRAQYAVEHWREHPDCNVGIVTGAKWGIVVVDLDGPVAFAWWEDFQEQYGTISTRTARSGRLDGGLHLYFRVPWRHRTSRLSGGNKLIAPKVDIKADAGYVAAPPSIHETGRCYHWIDHSEIADLPPALLEWLLRPVTREGSTVRHGRESDDLLLDLEDLHAQVQQVETDRYGKTAFERICKDLAGCPEGGGPLGGRDNLAYWAYGRAGFLVGKGRLDAAEALAGLGDALDANGLGRSRAKEHHFWERVREGIESLAADDPTDGQSDLEGVEPSTMSELADRSSNRTTAKSDIAGRGVGGGLPLRSSRTSPAASPLAMRLWEEGTFCVSMTRFSLKDRQVRRSPLPCGRRTCGPCQRRLLMERAEAAAVWLRKQDGGLLQSLVVESSGWPRIHKRLRRADAEYFKLPAPEGVVVVLLWSRGLLKDAELLGGLETFEARLEAAWWASRSMEGSGRVDSSTGWRSPKEDVETDWQHLGVLNARQADAVGRQFGLDDGKSGVSEPLDEQAMKWLGLSFPGADVFGQEGDVSRPNQSGMQDSGNE